MNFLLLSSFGDPKHPKLWSGTPENIYRRLKLYPNVEVATDNILKFKWVNNCVSLIEIVFHFDFRRSKFRNFVTNGFLLARFGRKSYQYDHIIFFDTVVDPGMLKRNEKFTKLSLVLDSTVAQWLRNTEWGLDASDKRKRRRMKYEKRVLKNFTHFFSLSSQASNSLIQDFEIDKSRIFRVRTGSGQPLIHLQLPKVSREREQLTLLTIAKGEHWRKGIDLLFQSLSFDTDGKIREINALLGSKYRGQIPNRVNRQGFVSLADLLSFYESADVFILPCRFEPYGLVFVEAVRMGLPIITTVNSGLGREFVESGWPGAIVELEPKSILEGILKVYSQMPFTDQAILDLQIEILRLFDWDNLISAILAE